MPPALNIPVKLDLEQLKQGLKDTSALNNSATRQLAKQFIDANSAIISTAGGIGRAVGAFRTFLGILGPLAVGITAVKGVFDLMSYATDLAKQKIEDFYQMADRAGKAGVSTDFFQRMTKSGEALKLTVADINSALDRFATRSQDRFGGSDLTNRLKELTDAGNFKGLNVSAIGAATGSEARLRAVVDLITDALAKGERLAALDLAEKVSGSKIADNLRANSTYLKEMLATADQMAASKIVSEEEIGRAIDLKNRLDEAQKLLAERFKPIQDDLAKLGMNYQESWVGIYETMAKAVGVGNDLYAALKEIPDIFARAGNAPFWSRLTEFTGKLGLNSDPAAMGLEPITSTSAGSPANRRLAGLLSDPAAVRRAMQDAIDAETKVLGDRSKAPTTAQASAGRDPFQSAIDQSNRRIAIINAEAATIGKEAEVRQRATIVAQLEEAAKRANAEAGKELYGVTEATNPAIKEQADRMLAAAKVAREQQDAFQGVHDALRYAGNQTLDILDQIGQKGATFGSIMANVFQNLSRQMLMAALTGEGAFAKLFGVAGGNGSVGGLFGAIGSLFTGGSSSALPMPGDGAFIGPVLKADGGPITGPGGPRDDRIPVLASDGEFIVNAASTAKHRALLEAINDNSLPRFADGGFVGSAPDLPMIGGSQTTIAPAINVTVQGNPGANPADHQRMGDTIAKAAMGSLQKMMGEEIRRQTRPGGLLDRTFRR